MTREQAIARLRLAAESGDTEAAHADADKVLCTLLIALGYADVVAEYEGVPKWYA